MNSPSSAANPDRSVQLEPDRGSFGRRISTADCVIPFATSASSTATWMRSWINGFGAPSVLTALLVEMQLGRLSDRLEEREGVSAGFGGGRTSAGESQTGGLCRRIRQRCRDANYANDANTGNAPSHTVDRTSDLWHSPRGRRESGYSSSILDVVRGNQDDH